MQKRIVITCELRCNHQSNRNAESRKMFVGPLQIDGFFDLKINESIHLTSDESLFDKPGFLPVKNCPKFTQDLVEYELR